MNIIDINIGQAGTKIGHQLFKHIHSEHFPLGQSPQGQHTVFFGQNKQNKYARAIFFDFNHENTNQILNQHSNLYKPSNMVINQPNCSPISYFQKQAYGSQAKTNNLSDSLRKQMELSDKSCGFTFITATSGTTGSSLSRYAHNVVGENYPGQITQSFLLLPQINCFSHPIQIYNTTHVICNELDRSDLTIFLDNPSITKILREENITQPSMHMINEKIATSISDTTIPYRFKGQLNTSQRKMAINLVPFPRLHFCVFSKSKSRSSNPLISALSPQNFLLSNFFESWHNTPIITTYAGIRSNFLTENEISPTIKQQFTNRNIKFSNWIPDLHISLHQPINGKQSASVILNSSHIASVFKKISKLFEKSFKKKAFLHHFLSEGMEEMTFKESKANLDDLCSQHQQYGQLDNID